MIAKDNFALKSISSVQQKKSDNLYAEIRYLSQEQWTALTDPSQMTQETFNSIQLRRMEIGPALEDISTKIFFQYPDFALHYAERLEKAFGLQTPDTDASNSGSCSEYEKIRQGILAEFDYDIGPSV